MLFKIFFSFFQFLKCINYLTALFFKQLKLRFFLFEHFFKKKFILLCLAVHLIEIRELEVFRIQIFVQVLDFMKESRVFLTKHFKFMFTLIWSLLKFVDHSEQIRNLKFHSIRISFLWSKFFIHKVQFLLHSLKVLGVPLHISFVVFLLILIFQFELFYFFIFLYQEPFKSL